MKVEVSFENNGLLYPASHITIDEHTFIEPPCAISAGAAFEGKYIGAFSHSWSYLPKSVRRIGRYTSIAANSTFYLHDHPVSYLMLSSCSYNNSTDFIWTMHEQKLGFALNKALSEMQDTDGDKATIIDNDVWIGHSTYIKPGIRIHTGAIVAAFSVVTKDVPPYAIVAGNPARIKRLRFPPETIQRLLASQWWRYDYAQLLKYNIDIRNPMDAVNSIARLEAEGLLSEYQPFELYKEIR